MGHTLFKHKAEQGYKYTAPESLLSRGCIFMALFGVSRTSRICEANSRWLCFVLKQTIATQEPDARICEANSRWLCFVLKQTEGPQEPDARICEANSRWLSYVLKQTIATQEPDTRICEANSRCLGFVSDGSFTWNCIKFPKFRYFPEKGLTEVT